MSKNSAGRAALAAAILLAMPKAYAFKIDTGNQDLSVTWDTTVRYSMLYRLHNPDQSMLNSFLISGAGDGDYNFNKGVASSRVDLISGLDVMYKHHTGFRISGEGWYDDVYHQSTDNNTPFTHNVDPTQFSSRTQKLAGRSGRLLDAYGFYRGYVDNMPYSVRLGRHAVIYGETLMSGANGIAAANGPVDIVRAATVPGAKVKEFILPTNQISGTFSPKENLSFGAYYQFKWERSPFFPAGTFLSPNDITGDGSHFLFQNAALPPFLQGVLGNVVYGGDLTPKKGGQWGVKMHYTPENLDVDFGLYAAKYHDKVASAIYFDPVNKTFTRAYQQDISVYGVSASGIIGSDNVSIEASVRHNQPVTGGLGTAPTCPTGCGYVIDDPNGMYNNSNNPGYALGNTGHVTLVDIHIFQPSALLPDGGSMATQFDWHKLLHVNKNPQAVDPTTTKDAASITVAFTADFFQIMDGVDMHIPIVYSDNLWGRSPIYVGWVENGGTLDVGATFDYHTVWHTGVNYHHFIGHKGTGIGSGNFDQTMADRDYLSFYLSRSF